MRITILHLHNIKKIFQTFLTDIYSCNISCKIEINIRQIFLYHGEREFHLVITWNITDISRRRSSDNFEGKIDLNYVVNILI